MIVIFGLPGAGKTYVGKILSKKLGWFYYDGDISLTPEITVSVQKNKPINDTMRDRFFTKLIEHVNLLPKNHANMVVSQTFIKEKYRQQFLQQFPDTQFVLVKTRTSIREARLEKRKTFQIDKQYARAMCRLFEPPKLTHLTIYNDTEGNMQIKLQIDQLFGKNLINNF